MPFSRLRKISSISSVLSIFIMKRRWIFKMLFLHQLIWSFDFYHLFYKYHVLHWFSFFKKNNVSCFVFLKNYLFIYLFIYLFLAVLGLRFCARAFSSCGKRGPLFIAVRGPLTVAASLVAEHRLQMRRLSSCGSWAQLLRCIWDPPRPGLEPVSPALAGRFSTTAPPGKPSSFLLISICMEYLLPSPHFQSVCVPRSEVGLL